MESRQHPNRRRPLGTARGAALLLTLGACSSTPEASIVEDVALQSRPDHILVSAGEEPFARVWLSERGPATIGDLWAPGERPVLRGFPISPRAGESIDHPEQRGLFVGHAQVEGSDCWHDPERVVVTSQSIRFGPGGAATLDLGLRWQSTTGDLLCDERRSLHFTARTDLRWIDSIHTLNAPAGGVTFGDVRQAFLALRLADEFAMDRPGASRIIEGETGSDGADRDDSANGMRARWMAWKADVADGDGAESVVTVIIFDHPDNHGHPTRWNVRRYGLWCANPFGIDAFEHAGARTVDVLRPRGPRGAVHLAPYDSMTLRYRIAVAASDLDREAIDEIWTDYAGTAHAPATSE